MLFDEFPLLKIFMYDNTMRRERKESEDITKCEPDNPRRQFFSILFHEIMIDTRESRATMKGRDDTGSAHTSDKRNKRSKWEGKLFAEYIELMLYMENLRSLSYDLREERKNSPEGLLPYSKHSNRLETLWG